MIITETGILVSTDPNMKDPAPLNFKIEGGQVGDNTVRATGLTGDTTYYAQSYFVKDGIYIRQKGLTEFKTAAQEEVLKIKNAYAGSNTIGITKTGSPDAITLDYSTDEGATWNAWNSANSNFSVTLAEGEEVWLKGNNYRISNGTSNCHNFTSSQVFECEGNLFSLIRKDTFILPDACFASLFKDSKVITPPELPAIDLGGSCYAQMFYGCSYLTTAPVLPATVIKQSSYWRMFYGCTSLTQAPAIPATSVGSSGCYQMFYGCTSLLSAPTLPATSVGESGYNGMFYGCTALTTAPATLPAIVMNTAGYRQMFYGCTSLTQAPDLPATTIADNCYYQMFYNCTALTQAPATLPGTALAQSCYREMFNGCTALTTPPASIQASAAAESCCYRMFYGCTSLVSAPTILPTTLAHSCYQSMFQGCTALTQAPATLPATTLADNCYAAMFQGCTSIRTAPTLPATTLNPSSYYSMFLGCTSLNRIVCYATSWNTNNATYWVSNVAPTGDFYNLGGANIPIDSRSGVPIGWTLHTSLGEYFTIENTDSTGRITNGFSLHKVGSPHLFVMEYSMDNGSTWLSYDFSQGRSLHITLNYGDKVMLRSNNPNGFFEDSSNRYYFEFGGSGTPDYPEPDKYYSMYGDVNTMINRIGGDITLPSNCFRHILNLPVGSHVDASGVVLPSTTLSSHCYHSMFIKCEFTTLPTLPATTLAEGCYYTMFSTTNITSIPSGYLPVTTLANECYQYMFGNCASLASVPANLLPATTLADSCYKQMFYLCASLASVPANLLPATTLAPYCYESMFESCNALTTVPSNLLHATTLAEYCCKRMFAQCTSLTSSPNLPATTLAKNCYDSMFSGCTSMTTSPSTLPATTLAEGCYNQMFAQCSVLASTPTLPATTLVKDCYRSMFTWCTSVDRIVTYASDISATDCITNWLYANSNQGDFYNLGGATYPSGYSGIPSSWTEHTSI